MKKRINIRWRLVVYDILILLAVELFLFVLYRNGETLTLSGIISQASLTFLCAFFCRFFGGVYSQIWRYGGIQCYIRLLMSDAVSCIINCCLELLLPMRKVTLAHLLTVCSINLLGSLAMRMMYRYAYKCGGCDGIKGKLLRLLLLIFAGNKMQFESIDAKGSTGKIGIAIIGAGRVGVSLA